MGNRPSYAWRSIMAAQYIVQQGYQWQVENGQAITIVKDKWIPKPSTFKLTSRHPEIPTDAKVSLLIDPCTRAW